MESSKKKAMFMVKSSKIKNAVNEIASIIYNLTVGMFKGLIDQSIETLELQLLDLQNAFLTLVLGGLVGMPLVPLGLAMELTPLLKDEIQIMETRHFLGSDVLADYFSTLGGEW
jgi:hypothetical protein